MVAYLKFEELKRPDVKRFSCNPFGAFFLDLTDFLMFQKLLIITIEICVFNTPPINNSKTKLLQKPVLLVALK